MNDKYAVENCATFDEDRRLFLETVKPASEHTDGSGGCSGFRMRFTTQPIYRERFLHTMWICSAFIMLGWISGLFGPTFPDLRLIINQSLDTSSWLFTSSSAGFLLGSLATGVLFNRLNTILVLVCSIAATAVTIAALPWCPYFYMMLVVKFLSGTFSAGLDTGGNAEVITIWGRDAGPYMQVLHFCFSLGGMVAPLVAKPFLATKDCLQIDRESNKTTLRENTMPASASGAIPIYPTRTIMSSVDVVEDGITMSANTIVTIESYSTVHDIRLNSILETELFGNKTDLNVLDNPADCVPVYGPTHIQFAYLVSAIVLLVTCVPFIVFLLMHRREKTRTGITPVERKDETGFSHLSLPLKLLILFLLSALMFVYVGIEDTYVGLLMTFTYMQLRWTPADGSYATSLYWVCFGVGRLGGILIVNFIRSVTLLYIFSILLVISFTGLLIASIFDITILLWVFIGMAGFSMSIIFPSVFTWTTESITPVSGKISALFMVSSSVGVMLNPLLFGYTMERYSPMWFVYLLLGQSVLWVLLYTVTLMLTRCLFTRKSNECANQEKEMMNVTTQTDI